MGENNKKKSKESMKWIEILGIPNLHVKKSMATNIISIEISSILLHF